MHLPEKIFRFPALYTIKVTILQTLNRMRGFALDQSIEGKNILDIGCGSKVHFYNPQKAAKRTAIDTSSQMVEAARKIYPESEYFVASAENLPFRDKSFDIVLFLFVLHHIKPEQWNVVLKEAKRVSREKIVILDHVQHDAPLRSFIQRTYWKNFDGGHVYRKEREWFSLFKDLNFKVNEYKRMGSLFGNICYFKIGSQ